MKLQDCSVLILYNTPRLAVAGGVRVESDASVLDQVDAVAHSLERLGLAYRRADIKYFRQLPELLVKSPELLVFNLVEGFQMRPEEANLVPAVCQAFHKGCTGNDTPALVLGLDKWRTKSILKHAGVPSPAGVLVAPGDPVPPIEGPAGKVIVKPMANDASEGIDADCVVDSADTAKVKAVVERLHKSFNQPVLIEPFIGKRELNVSVLQRGNRIDVMPLAEIDFSAFDDGKPPIVTYAAKWLPETFEYQNTPRIIPAPIPKRVADKVRRIARHAWEALGCRDYVRVDLRLTEELEPVVLEVNPNPDISPEGGFASAIEAAGMTYDMFVKTILENALTRLKAVSQPMAVAVTGSGGSTEALRIRYTEAADHEPIMTILRDTKFFRQDEVDVAGELLAEAAAKGTDGHYQSFAAELEGRVVGWVCHGPTPCCLGTFDIYWLAVSPDCQGKGVGRALTEFAENHIRQRQGRLIVVETSGRAIYDSTRAFYRRLGYNEVARLSDFYAPNDDKIIYLKKLG